MKIKDVLSTKMLDDENGETVRDYLKELLTSLWFQGDEFSGKRPFGNSGWKHDIYQSLAATDKFSGVVYYNDDGYEEWEIKEDNTYDVMDDLILKAIESL